MKEEYLQKVPTWYRDFTKYDVVLSDDIDGLVSTSALKYAKNWNVEYFYNHGLSHPTFLCLFFQSLFFNHS